MMWIDGLAPLQVFMAYAGTLAALLIFGVVAARQQHACQPVMRDVPAGVGVDWQSMGVVAVILVSVVSANAFLNLSNPATLDHRPVNGLAVSAATARDGTLAQAVLGAVRRGHAGKRSTAVAGVMSIDDAVKALARRSLAQCAGSGLAQRGVRQHSLDSAGSAPRWLWLRISDHEIAFGGSMIWFCSSAGEHVSTGRVGTGLDPRGPVCGTRLRGRLSGHASGGRLATRAQAQRGGCGAEGQCGEPGGSQMREPPCLGALARSPALARNAR